VALVTPRVEALERPSHELFQNASFFGYTDSCMKHLWPDVKDTCSKTSSYHGTCKARIGVLASKYGGSCDSYCSSFGFQCVAGYTPSPGSGGCDSEGTYLPCSQSTDAEDAICQCSDAMDTFMWKGAARVCGSGLALVGGGASSCEEFCDAQGLSCTSATQMRGAECSGGSPASCQSPLVGKSTVCQCSGAFDRSGAFAWPDKKELCGATAVLVSGDVLRKSDGTCNGYCNSLRSRVPGFDLHFTCYGAWPAGNRGCDAYTDMAKMMASFNSTSPIVSEAADSGDCQQDTAGQDTVCSCSFADL